MYLSMKIIVGLKEFEESLDVKISEKMGNVIDVLTLLLNTKN